jgi:hypothetical protein
VVVDEPSDAVVMQPENPPTTVVRLRRTWLARSLSEPWGCRGILRRFWAGDVTLRHRQTDLGVIWVDLVPLLGAGSKTPRFSEASALHPDVEIVSVAIDS